MIVYIIFFLFTMNLQKVEEEERCMNTYTAKEEGEGEW